MILVAGATGFLGGEICRQLAGRDKAVRGIIRRTSAPERVEYLRRLGVETTYADLKDAATLAPACAGVDTVVSTVSVTISRQPDDTIETVDRDGQLALVDAAAAAGVRHFVYISYGPIDEDDPSPLTRAKRAVERRLRESGLSYTILQPTVFMEIWLGPALGFDVAGGTINLYGSGEAPFSWISLVDVAWFAAEAVDNQEARNAVIRLGGPEALSPNQVVALAERTTGRPMAVQRVPVDALRAQHAAATDSLGRSFAALLLSYTRGEVIDMTGTLRRFPTRLTPVTDHIARVAGAAPAAVG